MSADVAPLVALPALEQKRAGSILNKAMKI
jgi:hypothetical protein